MDMEKPRFRNDLVAQPIEEEGIRYVDVTDPNSGSTFRFYDVEYSIACAMDGHKDLAGLVAWTKGELGIDTSVDELQGVVSTLADLGYLEAAASAAAAAGGFDDGIDEFAYSEPTRNVSGDVMEQKAREAEAKHADGKAARDTALENDPRAKVPTRRLTPEPMDAVGGKDVDLDIDLSAHAKLTKEDVKEAVRASRVVSVPQVSRDLLDHIEAEAEKKKEPPPPVTDVSAKKPSGATPLPKEPPKAVRPVETAARAPEPAKKSSAGPLLFFLLLAVVAGGAYWYFMIYKAEQAPAEPRPRASSVEAAPAAGGTGEAAGPRAIEAKVVESAGAPAEAKATAAGVVEWTADEGATVEKDAPVTKLVGAKRFEAALAQAEERKKFYEGELAKAEAARNQAVAVNLKKKVDEKQGLADAAAAGLAPLVVKAPAAGKVQILVGKGAKVNAGDPVARIDGGAALGASFDAGTAAAAYQAGAPCAVAPKGRPGETFACAVEAVEGEVVKVKLAGDAAVEAGDTVVLLPAK